MNKTVYLLCGVSGVGKTWVCKQVSHKFTYVPHDEHYHDLPEALIKASHTSFAPLLTEVPFGERVLKERLERVGFRVIPLFIVERPTIAAQRYQAREGKPIPKAAFTRASTIMTRVREWSAAYGTSAEMLAHLQDLKFGRHTTNG